MPKFYYRRDFENNEHLAYKAASLGLFRRDIHQFLKQFELEYRITVIPQGRSGGPDRSQLYTPIVEFSDEIAVLLRLNFGSDFLEPYLD